MAKHTSRDMVWNQALRFATAGESFELDRLRNELPEVVGDWTVRDTLEIMTDLEWLSKETGDNPSWHPGPRVQAGRSGMDSQGDSVEDLSDINRVGDLKEDTIYAAEVDRFAKSNAIISLEYGHVNLGPIDKTAQGEVVRFEFVGNMWGRCLTEEYINGDYSPRDGQSTSTSKRRSRSYPDQEPRQTSSSGSSTDITGTDPDNKNKLLKEICDLRLKISSRRYTNIRIVRDINTRGLYRCNRSASR